MEKKGILRKNEHELKTRKGGPCKDKSMKGFHKRMTILTRAKLQSRGYSGEFKDAY